VRREASALHRFFAYSTHEKWEHGPHTDRIKAVARDIIKRNANLFHVDALPSIWQTFRQAFPREIIYLSREREIARIFENICTRHKKETLKDQGPRGSSFILFPE